MAVDWGNVPGFIGCVVSVCLAVHVLRKDGREASDTRRSQARSIVVPPAITREAVDGPPSEVVLTASVSNYSTLPIYDVMLWGQGNQQNREDPPLEITEELRPTERLNLERRVRIEQVTEPLHAAASFRDAEGYYWVKWATGELKPSIHSGPRKGIIWRLSPFWLRRRWAERRNRSPFRARIDGDNRGC